MHWEHVYSTACPWHERMLVDRCDRCNTNLSLRRPNIVVCDCGRDLRAFDSPKARSDQLWLSGLVAGVRGNAQRAPRLQNVDIHALSKLVQTLCAMHEPGSTGPRRNAAKPKSVSEATEFLAPLEGLLANWPSGFQAHVIRRLKASDSSARTLNVALGTWYKSLKRHSFGCGSRSFLENTLKAAATVFPGLIGLDAAGVHGLTHDKPVALKEAARRLGVGRDGLVLAIERGFINAVTRRFGERRLMFQLSEAEVDRVLALRARWIGESTAGELLDIPDSVLENMAFAGGLVTDRQWDQGVMKGGPFSLASVQELAAKLRARVRPAEDDVDVIALRDLNSRRVGDKRALEAVFASIRSGNIMGVGALPAHGIGGIKYQMCDVREYFGTPILESGLSIHQLTKLTGWKHESVLHWIERGLLKCESIMLRGQQCRVISPTQLLDFTRAFLPLADLARSLGLRPSALAKKLSGVALVGAKCLPNGRSRGGLVRLSELTQLAISGALDESCDAIRR